MIDIGAATDPGYAVLQNKYGMLTFGPQVTIVQVGKFAEILAYNIESDGTIEAGFTGGYFVIAGTGAAGAAFTNQGAITVANGEDLFIEKGVTFSNLGTLTLAGTSRLILDNNLRPASLGTLSNISGTIVLGGTMTNTGHDLVIGTAGLGTLALDRGTIIGGTITGGELQFGRQGAFYSGGTLSGVTYDGTLRVGPSYYRYGVRIVNGISLYGANGTGMGSVALAGYLGIYGNQSLDNAVISVGTYGAIGGQFCTGLTLGPNLTITSLGGGFAALSGNSVVNDGTINAGGSFFELGSYTYLDNQGVIYVSNGDKLSLFPTNPLHPPKGGAIEGDGTIALAGGAMAVVTRVSAGTGGSIGQTIDFRDDTGRFTLEQSQYAFGGTIDGFRPGDTLGLSNLSFSSAGTVNMEAGNVLQVREDGGTFNFQFDPNRNFAGYFFHLARYGSAGTLITEDQNPCFLHGTLILTPAGEVPVEQLGIGALVTTASGEARPLKWVGRRSYAARFALGQKQILPVCVTAGTLADRIPKRDLWLSPNHALYLDGVLIEVSDLVNGTSIVQPEATGAIEYFHIELDSHDVLIANGAAAESYIDDDNRALFHNAADYRALYPEEQTRRARYCAPRLAQGDAVERVRAWIAHRFTQRARLPAPQPSTFVGTFVAGAALR